MTKIDVQWLEENGFTKLGGMQPVGLGTTYCLLLSKENNDVVYISATPDTYGNYPMHMVVKTKDNECKISKKKIIPDGNGGWIDNPFYVEELFALLELSGNESYKEFFN